MKALPYFDVNAETTLQMDASKKGLGACLIQKGKVICYALRALAKTEQNYKNLEIILPIIAVNMITTRIVMSVESQGLFPAS